MRGIAIWLSLKRESQSATPPTPTPLPPAGEGSFGKRGAPLNNYTRQYPDSLPDDLRQWAREMRHGMTDAEALMWRLLRGRRLVDAKFRRQHPLGCYILDFYCDDHRLCIELDGSQHIEQEGYDLTRSAWLQEQGITNLRFWNNQVLSETEAVMEAIYLALTTDKNPSPTGGMGGPRRPGVRAIANSLPLSGVADNSTSLTPTLLPSAGEGS